MYPYYLDCNGDLWLPPWLLASSGCNCCCCPGTGTTGLTGSTGSTGLTGSTGSTGSTGAAPAQPAAAEDAARIDTEIALLSDQLLDLAALVEELRETRQA